MSLQEHAMNPRGIPGRVFLDTCVVNFMLDFGPQIHDGDVLPVVTLRDAEDIEALRCIFLTRQRAAWQLAISPHTCFEIARTRDKGRCLDLNHWFQELWHSWRSTIELNNDFPSFIEAEDIRVQTLTSGFLACLPDVRDQVLICDAIVYRCNLFCTRDGSTILKHWQELSGLPIDIVTPSEWWDRIRPLARLWI